MSYVDGKTWYKEYLQSEHWQDYKRRKARHHERGKCRMCFCEEPTDCHHHTYSHVGHERITDTDFLCRACHEFVHKLGDLSITKKLSRAWRRACNKNRWWSIRNRDGERFKKLAFTFFKKHVCVQRLIKENLHKP